MRWGEQRKHGSRCGHFCAETMATHIAPLPGMKSADLNRSGFDLHESLHRMALASQCSDHRGAAGRDDPESGEQSMTLASALDMLGWGAFHWRFLIQCGLSWACDMIEIMLLSFLIPNIGSVFFAGASQATQELYSFLLGAVTFAGMLVGSLIFGIASDVWGRKFAYLASTAMIAIFGILCAAARDIQTLVALRCVVGIGLGGVTCSFTLLSELVGSRHRGRKIILVRTQARSFAPSSPFYPHAACQQLTLPPPSFLPSFLRVPAEHGRSVDLWRHLKRGRSVGLLHADPCGGVAVAVVRASERSSQCAPPRALPVARRVPPVRPCAWPRGPRTQNAALGGRRQRQGARVVGPPR